MEWEKSWNVSSENLYKLNWTDFAFNEQKKFKGFTNVYCKGAPVPNSFRAFHDYKEDILRMHPFQHNVSFNAFLVDHIIYEKMSKHKQNK